MNRYIVTGGAGFIGSHLVERLKANGDHVAVVDDLSSGVNHLPEAVQFIERSVQDWEGPRPQTVLAGIYHLAAEARIPESFEQPGLLARSNLLGTLRIIEIALRYECPMVFASSASVYGECRGRPDEDAKPDPGSPYAISKLWGEQMLRCFHAARGLSSVSCRFLNVYGPRLCERLAPARFLRAAIYGERAELDGGGMQTRDFVYVDDVVSALTAAMDLARRESMCEVVNLGSGRSLSIYDLMMLCFESVGAQANWRETPRRLGDVDEVCVDIARAARLLGWSPRTGLDRGLRLTAEWIQDHDSGTGTG